jgi:hypothetical protein
MPNRVFTILIALLGVSNSARAHKHRHAPAVLALQERDVWSGNQGAKVDPGTGAVNAVPPLANVSPTFVEYHSARVENDLILFPPTLIGIVPPVGARKPELFARAPAKKVAHFFTPTKIADDLEVRREHDKLLLFRDPQSQGASVGIGLAMFGATTILSAHVPPPFRILFDHPVHLGPAVFDGGGMGAGIAGRGL